MLQRIFPYTSTDIPFVFIIDEWDCIFREYKYDGYCFGGNLHIYSPRSVVSAMLMHNYDSFWNKTETFEALRDYIILNYKGLKGTVIELLSGTQKRINTDTFTNDMATFSSADDVLTLLIHLGYLGYDFNTKKVFIPNSEISSEFCNAVANGLADAHMETKEHQCIIEAWDK